MLLFKTSGKTFDSVISNQKHAFKSKPSNWSQSETVLVSKNLSDCVRGEKQIQYIMKINEIRLANQEELETLWPGNIDRWRYIADCYDTTRLPTPFNLDDILGTESRTYSPVMTFKKLSSPHVEKIEAFISKQSINPTKPPMTITVDSEEFNPSSEEDSRQRTLASIVRRRGQPAFRQALMTAYSGKCAVTGCDAKEALEAAHITPYMGDQTNAVQNGLLLRADFHTLFDLGLIAISPIDLRIILHSSLKDGHYSYLSGKMISVPNNKDYWPSATALKMHLENSKL